jgi:hypothetical protein
VGGWGFPVRTRVLEFGDMLDGASGMDKGVLRRGAVYRDGEKVFVKVYLCFGLDGMGLSSSVY